MSADFARFYGSGRMTSDPKVFDVGDTKKVVFSIACNKFFRKKGESEFTKKTTYIDCVAWSHLGNRIAKDGSKGCKVALDGDWEQDSYTTKDDKEIKRLQVNVRNICIFDSEGGGKVGAGASSSNSNDDDDIPF